jgi:hypothetical protein
MIMHPRKVFTIDGDGALAFGQISEAAFRKVLVRSALHEQEVQRSFAVPIRLGPLAVKGFSPFVPTDCPYFSPLQKSILLSERAIDVFGSLLDGAGQMFRTEQRQTETRYTILYVRRQVDALDEERSEVERFQSTGRISDVVRAEFHAERLRDAPIFRLPYGGMIYITDAIADLVQQHGLTGFKLTEVWSAESGGVHNPPEVYRFNGGIEASRPREDARRRALRAELAARQAAG